MSENRPLLAANDAYNRFSSGRKRVIVAVIALAGIIAPFASGSFVPCVPQVAKDLNTTGVYVNFTVGLYILVMSLGTLIWAPYSSFYGRQPIYLISLPLLCLGSLGASICQNIKQLAIARAIQALGASSVLSVGVGTIADIYRVEERGTAMGIYFGASLMGPAIAPLAGGLAATYASWRLMQLILFSISVFCLICVSILLPETMHPGSRGIDKLLLDETSSENSPTRKSRFVWINPFKSLTLLRGPNIFFVVLAGAFTLVTDYVLLIPLSYTIGDHYHLTNPAIVGACFVPSGLGNVIGAPLAGRLADKEVIKGLKRRGGQWYPEDRLRATVPGALILVPMSVLMVGLITEFVPGRVGLIINLICLFANGIGVDVVLSPSNTYMVDILHDRSAEVMAASSAFRNLFCSLASSLVLPSINRIGVAATNGIIAIMAWMTFILLWITVLYGEKLRAKVDIGYTTRIVDS